MLKSDRLYLAKFAVDPEMENQLDDINSLFDNDIEDTMEDGELDSLFESQDEMED